MQKQMILIIDDDSNIRKTLSDVLTVKGFDVSSACNGEEGLDLLKQIQANLVIVDLGLPDMPGLDVLGRIKADNPYTEAIILTGNASLDSAIEATNRGAFSYLTKPYDIDQLLLHIRRALEKQESQEKIAAHNIELEYINKILRETNAQLAKEVTKRIWAEEKRKKLIIELKDALSKIKTLSGLLPICASCKKIRNDKGYWEQIEEYISNRSNADFTHGICPDCMKKLYPEFCKDK
ncbi:MAG: response regulator [Spirochaetota bacterium]